MHTIDFHMTLPAVTFNLRKVELTSLEQRKLTFDSHTMVTELESRGEKIVHQLHGHDKLKKKHFYSNCFSLSQVLQSVKQS